jgi:hypothetical protein
LDIGADRLVKDQPADMVHLAHAGNRRRDFLCLRGLDHLFDGLSMDSHFEFLPVKMANGPDHIVPRYANAPNVKFSGLPN